MDAKNAVLLYLLWVDRRACTSLAVQVPSASGVEGWACLHQTMASLVSGQWSVVGCCNPLELLAKAPKLDFTLPLQASAANKLCRPTIFLMTKAGCPIPNP